LAGKVRQVGVSGNGEEAGPSREEPQGAGRFLRERGSGEARRGGREGRRFTSGGWEEHLGGPKPQESRGLRHPG